MGFSLSSKGDTRRGDFSFVQTTLSIQIHPWSPIRDLPMDRIGTFFLELTPKPVDSMNLIYEVSFREGSKIFLFRSNKLIVNSTKLPLEVKFEMQNQDALILKRPISKSPPNLSFKTHFFTFFFNTICTLEPGESRWIPLDIPSSALLRFRPFAEFEWSKQEVGLPSLPQDVYVIKSPSFRSVCFYVGQVLVDAKQSPEWSVPNIPNYSFPIHFFVLSFQWTSDNSIVASAGYWKLATLQIWISNFW